MKRGDVILGGAACVFGVAVFLGTLRFPEMPGGMPGPALFPRILSAILVLFGVIQILQARHAEVSGFVRYPTTAILKAGGVLIAIAAYILLLKQLGFLITAGAMLIGLMLMLRVRVRTAIPVSIGLVIACAFLFGRILLVPLPQGEMIPWRLGF